MLANNRKERMNLRYFKLKIFVITLIVGFSSSQADEVKPGIFRTPDARFENLSEYDFEPNYQYIDGYRIHYLDEGPSEGPVVLLIHGEPSWSYLYRKMIPVFVAAGYRTIVPDLLGFGKSDKPADRGDYSYQGMVDIIDQLITELELRDVSAFYQDWGGLVGLRVSAENEERFAKIAIGNTGLPAGEGDDGLIIGTQFSTANPDIRIESIENFQHWLRFSQSVPVLDIGEIMQWGTVNELSAAEIAAYNAPFPDDRYKAGARVMPTLVQSQMATNRGTWAVYANWQKPFLTTFSDSDPITTGGERVFQHRVPGARGQRHTIITEASHFLQEDKGEELAEYLVEWFAE